MEWELRRIQAEKSLYHFLRQAWPVIEPATEFVPGWHIEALCLHLEAVTDGVISNLLIAVPPGSTKSITVCVAWPAWVWATRPWVRWMFAANELSLAVRDSVACRRLIESDWYRERWGHRFQLMGDQNVKSWYENSRRGHRMATTVGSNVTGKKGDILVVDDANDARKVESDARREDVNSWWDKGWYNRVNDFKKGRRAVIGQRTHFKDLIGHASKSPEFETLCIPEQFESSRRCRTSIGWSDPRTEEGELLRPQRFGPEQVAEAVARLGSLGYAAQHQQRPVPAEGGLFKRDWLRWYRSDGIYFLLQRPDGRAEAVHRENCWFFLTVDLATSLKQTADKTMIGVWADDKQGRLILADLVWDRLEGPDIVPRIKAKMAQWGARFVLIESYGMQLSFVQTAARSGLAVKEYKEKGDKADKAVVATIRMENGTVYFPESAPWAGAFVGELCAFPRGEHDEAVDVVSMACWQMTKLYEDRPRTSKPMLIHMPASCNPHSL